MQAFSVHGWKDQCVCRHRFFVHRPLKRCWSPSLAFLKYKQGYCHKNLGYQKDWCGWLDRLAGAGKLKGLCFLTFWEEPSPAVCRPKETKCLAAETVSPVWGIVSPVWAASPSPSGVIPSFLLNMWWWWKQWGNA